MSTTRTNQIEEVQIHACLDGMIGSKMSNNPASLERMVLFLLNGPYKGKQRIYTDASKSGTNCAVGIYVEGSRRRLYYKLEEETSITSAKIIAIRIAMNHIDANGMGNVVLLTDSRAACDMLENVQEQMRGSEILVEILNLASRWKTTFQWVPSHISIYGNEVADELAKLGLTSEESAVYSNKLLRSDVLFRLSNIKQMKVEDWYQEYS